MKKETFKSFYFYIKPLQPGTDILLAELSELGFDSFRQTDDGLEAYITSNNYREDILDEVPILKNPHFTITHTVEDLENKNWNEEWEKNFSPIQVGDNCLIRAPFHDKKEVEFDIVIEPKMSFGTGHHATTHMMVELILRDDWEDKSVLDMGCGTGVLAILAEKKGARNIDAIDIDNWCYQNTLENVERNNCKHIKVYEGGAELLKDKKYSSIIANINRNVLLEDLPAYAEALEADAKLFLSGFYKEDLPILQEACEKLHLKYEDHLERDKWIAAKFVK